MKALQRALALGAVALLGAGIHVSAVRGLADVRYFDARTLLVAGTQERRLPEAGELEEAETSLREALALEPSNPLFVEQLARVHEMRALQMKNGDPARREELRRALRDFREAALKRPASPYAWAAIAALKFRLDEIDFEFYGALQRAERYGRWEPGIQVELADIGLAAWPLLAQPAKVLTLDAVARALPRQEKEVRRIAAAHGSLAQVCAEEARLCKPATGLCVRK